MNLPATDVVVIGGGIGGLAAALALGRRGRTVQVLERAANFTEIGAGLQLGPNGTGALRDLGVLEQAVARGLLPHRMVARNAVSGDELTHLELQGSVAERYGSPYLVMHRSDLLDVLLKACRAQPTISLTPGREVIGLDDLPDRVEVRTAAGSTYRAGIAIGADGLHSTLRSLISDDEPINSGYVAYRGAIPTTGRSLGPSVDVTVWFGPGLHLVQYPLRADGSLFNQVAVFRSDDFTAGVADWGNPAELARRFAGTHPEVRAALAGLGKDRRWEMHDRESLPRWSTGRLALLGDAAHPMLQYLAQGSCQALEDAVHLAGCVAEHVDGSASAGSVEQAFDAYEQVRQPRVDLVQARARTWGEIWHVGGIATALRDEAFRLRAADDFSHIDWLYAPQHADSAAPTTVASGLRSS